MVGVWDGIVERMAEILSEIIINHLSSYSNLYFIFSCFPMIFPRPLPLWNSSFCGNKQGENVWKKNLRIIREHVRSKPKNGLEWSITKSSQLRNHSFNLESSQKLPTKEYWMHNLKGLWEDQGEIWRIYWRKGAEVWQSDERSRSFLEVDQWDVECLMGVWELIKRCLLDLCGLN